MIHYFNPGHETAVKNGSPYYMSPANIARMKKDLAFLPAWYADSGDLVLVEEKGEENFYNMLNTELAFNIKAIEKKELVNYADEEIALWGISPQSVFFFEELARQYLLNLNIPRWHEQYIYLNSRQAARDVLEMLIKTIPSLSGKLLPLFLSRLEDIEAEVNKSELQLLVKAPYSSSGRGLLWLPLGGLTRTERQIINGILNKQGVISLERVLNRQVDFAMEFQSDGSGNVRFVGYSLFETNSKGAYLGNILRPQSYIETYLAEMLPLAFLEEVRKLLMDVLSQKLTIYKGYIGVDMMIYKENGDYQLHPCVEINMRSNMGVLAINIQQKYLSPQSVGKFYVDFSSKEGEMYARHHEMMNLSLLQVDDNKIVAGYLPLCPVTPDSCYRAYIIVNQ